MTFRFIYILPFILLSCSEERSDKKEADPEPQQEKTNTASTPSVAATFDNNVAKFSTKEGWIGVSEVGQMLVLSIIDSAAMEQVAEKAGQAYDLIQKDLEYTGAQPDGPLGQISYNNNPLNFTFECIALIKSIPEKKPLHSKIVVLEASHMLVYNHYGAYKDLYKSYAKIRQICSENGFVQTAPVREFYMNDPTVEKDPSKWLTRILLPVRKK